jgi:hypothetical protein
MVVAGEVSMTEIDEELFLMTNLYPATTGLPMVIWVGPSYGAQHDIRIKVMMTHGTRMDPGNLAVVAVRPTPHVVAGQLAPADERAVAQWIALNENAIIDHWNGVTDGVQLGQQLQRLPSAGARPQRPAVRTTTLHTIIFAKPYDEHGRMLVQFNDDPDAVVDLSTFFIQGGLFDPLRDFQRFAVVEVGPDGHSIFWRVDEDIVELSADTLWLMAHPANLHTVNWVKPISGGHHLNLTFDDKPIEVGDVDLSSLPEKSEVFEPLRDPALFGKAEVGPNGRAVIWRVGEKIIELSADALWRMARESR